VLTSLETFVNGINNNVEQDKDLLRQVDDEIRGTEDVLSKLQLDISKFIKSEVPSAFERRVRRLRFMWNDREIQATQKRLQARKQSLELVLNCWNRYVCSNRLRSLLTWTSSDGARMRDELEKIRKLQEKIFDAFHQNTLLSMAVNASGSSSRDTALTQNTPVGSVPPVIDSITR
jgi:hypothetical protein